MGNVMELLGSGSEYGVEFTFKVQDNIPKLRETYLKVLQLTAFLSFPIVGLIFVLAPDFIRLFLGEKWMPMVSAMQVLVFLIYPLTVYWNILGTSIPVLLSALVMFIIRSNILIKAINSNTLEFFKLIFVPMVLTVTIIFSIISLKVLIVESMNIYYFFSFIIFFIFLNYIADRFLNYRIKGILKDILKLF